MVDFDFWVLGPVGVAKQRSSGLHTGWQLFVEVVHVSCPPCDVSSGLQDRTCLVS